MPPQGEALKTGKVLHQVIDENRKLIVIHNENPLLNNLAYNVEFQDSTVKRYRSNIIAENILFQCNPDGFYMNVMEAIMDHKCDD